MPIDLSEQSRKTVSYAARLASRYNATLQLLHVIDISDFTPIHYQCRQGSVDRHKSELNAAEGEALESLAAFEDQLRDRGNEVETNLRVGFPFEEIVQMAQHLDVDLIILGSRGLTGLKHLLLGSTAERVVEHARCPVLVVKDVRPLLHGR